MKICKTCQVDLPDQDFAYYFSRKEKGKKTSTLRPSCLKCEKEGLRRYRVWMRALVGRWKKMKGCQRCGFRADFSFQLELDHMDRSTKKRVNGTYRAVEVTWSKKRVKAELAKCQVLCKNCHALKTYYEFKNENLPKL